MTGVSGISFLQGSCSTASSVPVLPHLAGSCLLSCAHQRIRSLPLLLQQSFAARDHRWLCLLKPCSQLLGISWRCLLHCLALPIQCKQHHCKFTQPLHSPLLGESVVFKVTSLTSWCLTVTPIKVPEKLPLPLGAIPEG